MKRTCHICGEEFEARNKFNTVCNICRLDMYRAQKQQSKEKTHVNQKIIDQVKEATKLGLSYGQFKGRGSK